ncbi:MAG: dihydroorotate dehydrogenase [Candidatus Heimdallarchaeota archaeon]|nr:dihydroorotate dehydrogenase [Candidatus Heimdallarchaeota archaeon]
MLETTLCSIKMRNPLMLASGVLGVTASLMTRVSNAGCGAIMTKSIGPKPKEGYRNPTVVELGGGSLINAMGLPNPGCTDFLPELKMAKKNCEAPIIASIFGESVEEFVRVAETLMNGAPDAFELNVSCPHGGKYGAIIGQDCELVSEITRAIKTTVDVPVFVKLSPNLTDLLPSARAAIDGGADAIVAINTVRAMAIDINYKKPILANKSGGLSGPAIRPIAIKCVYDLYSSIGKTVPIIGVGGISKWEDVVEFLLAGATTVQIGTAIAYHQNPRKITLFQELSKGLAQYLENEGLSSPSELIGLAHS